MYYIFINEIVIFRGVAKLGCSDHFTGRVKEEKLNQVDQIMDIER